MIPEELHDAINSVVPNGVTHLGFVVTNTLGQYLVTEPNGHPYGVTATFNKVKVKIDERPSQTVERCLRDQVGQSVVGVFPIPIVWSTSNSNGFYLAGMMKNEGQPVPHQGNRAAWLDFQDAESLISESGNLESRRRDLGLLAAASEMCLSPYRRILLMVRELHQLGFQRLRAPAYEYPLAWRCPIVPAYWTLRSHGGMYDEPNSQMEHWFGIKSGQHVYSSASGQFPFGWNDAAFSTPTELAIRFVRERREIACAGWGPDPEYARWLEVALAATAPNGLFHSFAEFEKPTDYLYTDMARVDRVPLPPPGWVAEGELSQHGTDFLDDDGLS
ncbi:hypothetical protein [Aporhodopirellula aestuarii]|uniref:Uncharacterized protein n=1 Tax=Aporhodopirellula aestuarii TaxID=2950107 RepID=A0ABT0U2F6_9BACT|nr:hypothetical protein [Aporhodopirellula aestuarii]MCM2371086.1 hypothetical protein [Aporhodopirellula aestuarii]